MLKALLTAYSGKIYVYLDSEDICRRFFQDAESEGFVFGDGTKPTQKHTSNLIAINSDLTLSYVGHIGRIAYQSASTVGGQPLHRVNYRDFLSQTEKK